MKIPVAVPVVLVSCLFAVSPATAQICGDKVRDVGEQCDDGATHNLDGCSATCQFEQTHRITDLRLRQNLGDATCPDNRFGNALNTLSLIPTNNSIAASIEAGATSILLQFLGLDDLTGVDEAALQVGIMSGPPVLPGSIPYDGNATTDLDWWYTPAGALLDVDRLPANRLDGSITASALTTTPGAARVDLLLQGVPASFAISGLHISVPTGAASTPLTSAGLPPGHLEAEQLDPALQSFATAGTLTGIPAAPSGRLCGNISAMSMRLTPIPAALQAGGATPCFEGYTLANSLLDVFVVGCTGVPLVGTAVAPSQPDKEDPAAPPAGDGPQYTLTADPTTHIVNDCISNLVSVDLTTCLQDAAYSSHFRFLSQRVIARDDLIFEDGFETVI